MFRPSVHSAANGKSASSSGVTNSSPNKQQSSNNNNNTSDNVPSSTSTIREIRSRTIGGTGSSSVGSARQLLASRRQAMSMERLNGSSMPNATSLASMNNINNFSDKSEKSSPINGSSNSISGSTASSPSRGSSASSNGGLNRTASRVSRFRSAKAVFERLSSVNSAVLAKPDRQPAGVTGTLERSKGTVVSRYAAAAAARGAAGQQNLISGKNNTGSAPSATSPRSRTTSKSPLRGAQDHQTGNRSSSSNGNSKPASNQSSPKQDNHPKPQPRVITIATRRTPIITASQTTSMTSRINSTLSTADQQISKSIASRMTSITKSTTTSTTLMTNASGPGAASNNQSAGTAKPPPKDLIDKIVLEIVRDANIEHDSNCTIQDLSNCDISGIPETLDFDKCFQDVEMMTEEEARKLLSRKSESPSSSNNTNNNESSDFDSCTPIKTREMNEFHEERDMSVGQQPSAGQLGVGDELTQQQQEESPNSSIRDPAASSQLDASPPAAIPCFLEHSEEPSSHSLMPPMMSQQQTSTTTKCKVRFSDEPVTVYDTHAASDYDRRNDDIDPVAASAEYEIEKSKEREGIRDDNDEDNEDEDVAIHQLAVGAVIERFNQGSSIMKTFEDYQVGSHTPQSVAAAARGGDHLDSSDNYRQQQAPSGINDDDDEENQASSRKDYIESLEREVSLKRILEQNLRDLQSQYYETVKQLDCFKGEAEAKISKLNEDLADIRGHYESAQGELIDVREQSNQFEKQINDIKESSQLLEKKYHRAKRIIKDMQSREESFTRREQLYQQKLDEIEYELGVLINTIDKTIYADGLKYFSLSTTDNNNCPRQHQTRLDVLGLIKQIMDNFNNNKKTQSAQIKQRIVTMLEQQLASLLANSNGCTSITAGPVVPIPPIVSSSATSKQTTATSTTMSTMSTTTTNVPHPSSNNNNNNNNDNNNNNNNKHNYSYASHRLSQPNMPHPIGVGGQPTKIFHGLNAVPIVAPLNEPSPPQSVNSYPSTNSLNSLNINNNNTNSNNNVQQVVSSSNNTSDSLVASKFQDHHKLVGVGSGSAGGDPDAGLAPDPTTAASLGDQVFQSMPLDVQVPYQTNEWHDKPVSEWTTTQVSTWLLALGLDQYISKFEDRNVNGQSLINLDSTVLKGLGVLNSNDRNLLKKKIRELRVEMEKERKIIEKKMKENLKEKSKVQAPSQTNKQSWKKSLLS